MKITVQIRGKPYIFERGLEEPLGGLREEIASTFSFAPESLKLIMAGKSLPDSLPLGSLEKRGRGERGEKGEKGEEEVLLLAVGSTAAEVAGVKEARPDPLVAPFRRKAAHSSVMTSSSSSSIRGFQNPILSSGYGFERLEVLEGLPMQEEAKRILEQLVSEAGVRHVMEAHKWKVGVLEEMFPSGKVGVDPVCVLGYNTNQGQKISLRLRTDDLRGFRLYERTREVLFHELAHNHFSDHDDRFYQFMRELQREALKADWTRSQGRSLAGGAATSSAAPAYVYPQEEEEEEGSSSSSHRLGGGNLREASRSLPPRELMALAASRRVHHQVKEEEDLKEGRREQETAEEGGGDEMEVEREGPVLERQIEREIDKEIEEQVEAEIIQGEESLEARGDLERSFEQGGRGREEEEAGREDPQSKEARLEKEEGAPHPKEAQPPSEAPATKGQGQEDGAGGGSLPSLDPETDERIKKIRSSLSILKSESSAPEAKEAVELLGIYLSNLIRDPSNPKFRAIRASNPIFLGKVASRKGALEILQACGFYQEEDHWVWKRNDPGLLWLGKSLLEEG